MSKYRFKTREEFIRDDLWDYENNVPLGWALNGNMNSFLGSDVPESLDKYCDSKGDFFFRGWGFSSEDYVLKEKNTVNANGFEYFGDKVMEVSEDGKRWITRVVFGKKNELYIAWAGGKCSNLEGARAINSTVSWEYARRIKTKLTLQEIADKFGLNKDEIEII